MLAATRRIFPRWMVALAAIFAIGWLLYLLRGALTPVFFAFLIAYMLDPVVDRFEARGYSRGVGIAVMLTVVLGGITLFLALALPGAIRDLVTFFSDLPAKARQLANLAEPLLQRLGVSADDSFDKILAQLHVDAGELAKQAAVPAGTVLKALFGGALSLLGALASLLLIPVFAAYLLYDFDRITAGVRDLVPLRYRGFVVEVARDVDGILGEFIRGQLIVMLILAVLYSLAYAIIGVRLAFLIGVVAGFLSFIPYVGGGVAVGLGVVMSLIYWTGWGQLIGVIVAYSIIQVIEGFVITPRVVGDKVGLSAVWVLFALLVGGEVFGFMGVLLALPAAAVIKIFVGRGLSWYRASELFLGGAPLPDVLEVTPTKPEVEVEATVEPSPAVEAEPPVAPEPSVAPESAAPKPPDEPA
ncbi:AI-2E family transporter [Paraliomyxa miuraensis]|uniref:AI-2E family transporter n=1 Tax=Paraliomyxa miuraensis TaxID=376150 RepID=UPI002257288A|nr:AI-2E family transporter [Paraliomyxa miuraensis]MCX4242468.1 AI-2E family transporter [Paraliomyxa miuraensis]